MNILDLPPEIFEKIIYHSIIARASTTAYHGVSRGLRLGLVCMTFYHSVEKALFDTKLLDQHTIRVQGNKPSYGDLHLMENWRMRRYYGADQFWHRYNVYKAKKSNVTHPGFIQIRKIARAICDETKADYDDTLDEICWLAHEGATESNIDYMYDDYTDKRGWTLSSILPLLREDAPENHGILAAAAHFNLIPLAKRLLQEGHEPHCHNHVIDAPIFVAAYAGHLEMLALMQNHDPFAGDQDDERKERFWRGWTCAARRNAIIGAALRGDLSLLKEACDRPAPLQDIGPDDDLPRESLSLDFVNDFSADPARYETWGWGPFSLNGDIDRAAKFTSDVEVFKYADSIGPLVKTPVGEREDYCECCGWMYLDERVEMLPRVRRAENYLEILCKACWFGHLDIVRLLIPHEVVDIDGVIPDDDLVYHRRWHPDRPGNVNYKWKGWQPLSIAARSSHDDIVDFLLEHGADPNRSAYADYESPMAAAAQAGSLTIVTKLLDHGARCDPAAFRNAAVLEHMGLLNLMRERGKVDGDHLTAALHEAALRGLESMVRLLCQWGARLKYPLDETEYEEGWAREIKRMKALIDELWDAEWPSLAKLALE